MSVYAHAQTNYYVDAINGNDNYSGISQLNAWKTIQKACNSAIPNSIVQIKGGTYHENLTINVNGTSGNPIIFRNFGIDVVIIDGTGTTGTVMLEILDKHFLQFENLTIKNLTVNYAKGIHVNTTQNGSSSGLVFKNINISNIGWTNSTAAIPSASNNAWGMEIVGRNGGVTDVTVDGCNISNNILGYSEALTISGNIDGFIVKNSAIHDNNNIGIDMLGNYGKSDNPETDKPRNGVITNNSCYRNISSLAVSAGIYVDGAESITIEKNNCYQNGLGIEVGCEQDGDSSYITVKNNLIYGNQNSGLAIGGYTTATTGQVLFSTVRNNTFFQNNALLTGMPELTISKVSNCVFEENLIYANSQNIMMTLDDIVPQQNNLINYNCWYTPAGVQNSFIVYWGLASYSSFLAYKNGSQQDSNSIYVNPGLVNAVLPTPTLQLLPTSSCINAGNPVLQINSETDFDGNPRIKNGIIDIGAREFQGSLATPNVAMNAPFLVYPNPFSTRAEISFGTELENATLFLFDMTGRKVREMRNISGTQMVLDKNGLADGIYCYEFVQEGQILATGKLIAQ